MVFCFRKKQIINLKKKHMLWLIQFRFLYKHSYFFIHMMNTSFVFVSEFSVTSILLNYNTLLFMVQLKPTTGVRSNFAFWLLWLISRFRSLFCCNLISRSNRMLDDDLSWFHVLWLFWSYLLHGSWNTVYIYHKFSNSAYHIKKCTVC